jgi:hypothetical protein
MVQGRFYGSAFKTKTMATAETLLSGIEQLYERFQLRTEGGVRLEVIRISLEFYRAEIEIEKLRVLNEIRIELERVGDMLENKNKK